jgi:hypothetical protein
LAPTPDELALWRTLNAWGGLEAPRLLYDEVFGAAGRFDGLVGDLFRWRGLDLARLFEAEWLTLVWPRWFSELAGWEAALLRSPAVSVDLSSADRLGTWIVAHCIAPRHPGTRLKGVRGDAAGWPTEGTSAPWLPTPAYQLAVFLASARGWAQGLRSPGLHRVEGSAVAFVPVSDKIAPSIVPVAAAWAARAPGGTLFAGTRPPSLDPATPLEPIQLPVGPGEAARAVWEAAVLRRRWYAHARRALAERVADWRGWDLAPLLVPFLDAVFGRLPRAMLDLRGVAAFCQGYRPSALVLPLDGSASIRALALGARLAGVPVIGVQYGMVADNPEISAPVEDVVCLQGEETRGWYLRRGAPAERLVVTGSPALDGLPALAEQRPALRAALAALLGLSPARPWVVVATWKAQAVYPAEVKAREVDLICAALARLGRVEVLFKLHPSDEGAGRVEMEAAAAHGLDAQVVADVTLNERLLAAADALVSNYSTLVLTGVLLGLPTVLVDAAGFKQAPLRPYVDDGVAAFADHAQALERELALALRGREAFWSGREAALERFVAARVHRMDGGSAARVVQVIEQVVAQRRAAGGSRG